MTGIVDPIVADTPQRERRIAERLFATLKSGTSAGVALPLALLWLAVIAAAALAPWLLTERSAIETDLLAALKGPSLSHPFGTDALGRDIYARTIYGAQISMAIGVFSVAVALAGGMVLGIGSGALRGRAGLIAARGLDVLASFPVMLMTLVVISVLGRGTVPLVLAIGLASMAEYGRLIRSQVLSLRERPWVEASIEIGNPFAVTLLRHILPNALGPVLIIATVGIGTAILIGSSLSFLGFGPPSPAPEWGVMLNDGRAYAVVAWWLVLFPGLALTATVAAITVVGRLLQNRFEGRLS